jgi:type IV secretion system protein VirD4
MTNNEWLHAKDGLIVGLDEKNNYYRVDGYQHLLLLAPTGTGKGVAFVLPNLLSWQESVIIHDIKLENFQMTSGWRASQGQKIYLFNPLEPNSKTHCYNPLDFVSKNADQMFDDLEKMAFILLSDHHSCHKQDHSQARGLFIGLSAYLMVHPNKPKTFGEIFRMLSGDLWTELSEGIKKHKIHPNGMMLINNFLNTPEKKRYKIVTSLESHLELWSNPLIDKATAKSDFNPANFRKEKATLYVGLEPGDINRLKPLMQFFYQHIMQSLCNHDPDTKHGVLLLLDDFSSIGRMEALIKGVSYFRGYKVRLALIAQDLNDIKSSYCDKGTHTIVNNVSFKVAFTTNSTETAEFLKDRAKVDLMNLAKDQQIILTDYEKPVVAKKPRYYDIKELKDKVIDALKLKFK